MARAIDSIIQLCLKAEPLKKTIKLIWGCLPLYFRVVLGKLPNTVRVDYGPKKLFLSVSSIAEIGRAGCCQKEPDTVQWIERRVRGVFYDIGANVGGYSLVAWAASEGRTRVFSFEPSFSTFGSLCRNIILNNAQATIVPLNLALSGRSGLASFQYGSLDPGSASHPGITPEQEGKSAIVQQSVTRLPIWTYSLDDAISKFLLPAPTHIKIDVDGAEFDVLTGAQRTLAQGTVRSVQVEVQEKDGDAFDIRVFLEARGFKIVRKSRHLDGPIVDYEFESIKPNVGAV